MKLSWLPIRSFCKHFNFLFAGKEHRLVKKYSASEPLYQPVFIVGAPRSGSTILYQTITNNLNTIYVSNLIDLCRETPMIGFLLHDIFFDSRPHDSFTSKYGNTSRLYEPNESLLWYNWLTRGEHFILPEDLSSEKKKAFKQTVIAILNRFSKPWIIKNLSFGMRMKLIKELFPEAHVIHIKRNIFFNAQSIYLAYRKFNIPDNQLWSIKPPKYKELLNLPLEEKVVAQIYFIEKEIEQNSDLFGNRMITVQFEEFIKEPEFYVNNIGEQINAQVRPQAAEIKVFNTNNLKITLKEQQLIHSAISKYYG